ncbi:MAG: hypothetical protein RLZZ299_3043 [Pseudomonadota bacterium]|jgi:hypothetical protein
MNEKESIDVRSFVEVQRERADFGGVCAGAAVAVAVGLGLMALGAAIGLSALNPGQGDWGGRAAVVGGGAWTLVSIVIGSTVGGWATVRLGGHFHRADAAAHGLSTWALAFVTTLGFTSALSVATMNPTAIAASVPAAEAPAASAPPTPEAGVVPEALPGETPLAPNVPQENVQAAANAGAWASWGFFTTALLAAIGAILGATWALPASVRRVERGPTVREPLRPADT